MIHASVFGKTSDGRDVLAFKIKDGVNEATILNLGGIVQSLKVADKDGNPVDVILGYNDVASYEQDPNYFGALVGRVAGRIEKGRFTADGVTYELTRNEGENHHHGGKNGFHKKIWNHVYDGPRGDILALSLIIPDGEEGYPGDVKVQINYSLVGGALRIDYAAMSNRKTALSFTNHSYFNLDGEGNGNVLDTFLQIDADRITPIDEERLSRGDFKDVAGTPFDFRKGRRIGERVGDTDDADIRNGDGYDVNFVLNKKAGEFAKIAEAEGSRSGILMEVFTDMPGVQLYTGNGLNVQGKSGHYSRYAGFALETQYFPNAVNCPSYAAFGDPIYDMNKIYRSSTVYKFSVSQD